MDDPTKTRGLLADLGHTDACVHPDQHAAVIREWEDAAAEVERLRKELAEALAMAANACDDCQARAEDAEAERAAEARCAVSLRREVERLRKDLDKALDRQLEYANRAIANGERAEQAEAERDALKAATEVVRALHARDDSNRRGPWCNACLNVWPCRTYTALDHPTDTGVDLNVTNDIQASGPVPERPPTDTNGDRDA